MIEFYSVYMYMYSIPNWSLELISHILLYNNHVFRTLHVDSGFSVNFGLFLGEIEHQRARS